jgi:DNA-binding MarR family transcriptional regulator
MDRARPRVNDQGMNDNDEFGALFEAFVNRVWRPRGRVLNLMAEASVTVPQAILMNLALAAPGCTPSSLATTMALSLPSVSQMIERLAKLGFVRRVEDPQDRRRKMIEVTPRAKIFLERLRVVRSAEVAAGAADLSDATRRSLSDALSQALRELTAARPN